LPGYKIVAAVEAAFPQNIFVPGFDGNEVLDRRSFGEKIAASMIVSASIEIPNAVESRPY